MITPTGKGFVVILFLAIAAAIFFVLAIINGASLLTLAGCALLVVAVSS